MTQQPWPESFGAGDVVAPATFATARVAFVESFSRLEGCIAKIISHFDGQFDLRAPFGNKLKALAALKAPSLSKKATDRFARLGREITILVQIRNDLVHGIMSVVTHDNTTKAAFQNAADLACGLPQFMLLSLDDLEAGRKRLHQIANELKQLANPPSPPRPSQDATSGP